MKIFEKIIHVLFLLIGSKIEARDFFSLTRIGYEDGLRVLDELLGVPLDLVRLVGEVLELGIVLSPLGFAHLLLRKLRTHFVGEMI